MSKEPISKVYLIIEKIEYIEQIVNNTGSITKALEDSITTRPAILMHLTAIAEQFNKLKQIQATELLNHFDKDDIKGMYDTRTYIAHEYEGVNLAIVEWIIRHGLPKFKKQCLTIIEQYNHTKHPKKNKDFS
jgi:uncharacterized protein with HEPN domain